MDFVTVENKDGVALVTLERGKVNALNEQFLKELEETFSRLKEDESVSAAVITGSGSFFSFGFDVPEGVKFERPRFGAFIRDFCRLYREIFLFPKPLVAAINGHAVAGGCMLAICCDYRLAAGGKVKMGLNEINFGASIFAGLAAILERLVGYRSAREMLFGGGFYLPDEALEMGLVDRVVAPEDLLEEAVGLARELGEKPKAALASLKGLLNGPLAEGYFAREEESIEEFLDIWYSPETREMIEKIEIR